MSKSSLFHHDEIARFVPEFVMAQLEADAALAKIAHRTTRNLVIVLIETGLRGGDACNLAFGSVFQDSTGWPCLRFEATKVRTEQLVPLSAKAAAAIADQQAYVREHWPQGRPWLFPGLAGNDDGSKPYSHSHFTRQLVAWEEAIDLHDQAGQAVRVTGHQFRHTLGTRLINSGVPQHVVQKLLGHASPNMTGHYAKVHDATVREAFDRYQSQRVDIAGERVGYDPDSPTASAEWVKQNLNRVRDSLPNGYCATPGATGMPTPQCVPHLPGLPDHARVLRSPPSPGRHQPAPDRPGRRQGPVPPGQEPAPCPGQPGAHHPRSGSDRRRTGPRKWRLTAWQKPTPAGTGQPSLLPTAPSTSSAVTGEP